MEAVDRSAWGTGAGGPCRNPGSTQDARAGLGERAAAAGSPVPPGRHRRRTVPANDKHESVMCHSLKGQTLLSKPTQRKQHRDGMSGRRLPNPHQAAQHLSSHISRETWPRQG